MKKTAIITGGSSGIGLATAHLLAADHWQVFEFSRRGLAEPGVIHIDADLRDEQSIQAAFDQFALHSDTLDLLINNAGFGISGPVEYTPLSQAKEQFEVNFFAGVSCMQKALPYLRQSRGQIINVSSVAAPLSIPFQAFYSASKSAINALTLALANEVKDSAVRVSAVMPGDVRTGFTAARRKIAKGEAVYGSAAGQAVSAMEKDEQNGMSPEYVAKIIYKICQKKHPKPLYVAGGKYKLFYVLGKILPASLTNRLIRGIYMK